MTESLTIEIKPDDKGTWTVIAKTGPDAAPAYMALGRNRVQVEFLARGILADQESEAAR
jgi:hypothetical protein